MTPKYQSVKLPQQMWQTCQKIIEDHPECGWKSVSDFVRDTIRHYEYWKRFVFEETRK